MLGWECLVPDYRAVKEQRLNRKYDHKITVIRLTSESMIWLWYYAQPTDVALWLALGNNMGGKVAGWNPTQS